MAVTIVDDFRQGLARGSLLIQKCLDCGQFTMYPKHACPHCQSHNLGWQEAGGEGTLMSYTVLRAGPPEGFEDDLPYALGVVRLTEGVQLLARLEPTGEKDWSGYGCDCKVSFSGSSAHNIGERPCAWFARA